MKFPFLKFLQKSTPGPVDECDIGPESEHRRDREQFHTVLHSFDATRIDDRLAILDIFLSIEDHVTLAELVTVVKKEQPQLVDQIFLQETMTMFCKYGFAQRQDFESIETRYEHLHLGNHHDHMICTKCGKIQEFHNDQLENIQIDIAAKYEFHPLQHKTEIYGLCSDCMATRQATLPLHMAANGETVKIMEIQGGRQARKRLTDMGLTVGSCLEVVSNTSGPFVVIVNQTRLALGSGIAQNIMVSHSCLHNQHHSHSQQQQENESTDS